MGKEPKNGFSWSKTRDQTFRECLRKYYFQYYGGWGGWFQEADPRVRQIYLLKNLYTRQMWAGDHVHLCLEKVLGILRRGLEAPAEDEVVRNMIEDMRRDFNPHFSPGFRREAVELPARAALCSLGTTTT